MKAEYSGKDRNNRKLTTSSGKLRHIGTILSYRNKEAGNHSQVSPQAIRVELSGSMKNNNKSKESSKMFNSSGSKPSQKNKKVGTNNSTNSIIDKSKVTGNYSKRKNKPGEEYKRLSCIGEL